MARLPSVTSPIPRDLRTYLDRVREALSGGGEDAVVTVRQLVAAGVATYTGDVLGPVAAGTYGTPATPEGVTATGALASVLLTWNKPVYPGHAYAEIWAADGLNASIANAELVGMSPGTFFAHNIGAGGQRTYWIRFINYDGLAGAYHATEGTNGETSQDPEYLMQVLTEAYGTNSESPFFQLDQATTINGVSIPAGTYMKAAFIVDGSITRAKIGDAAIDNAKIANVDASKITTGYLDADRIEAGSITASMIDSRGLSIKDSNGNIVLAAGSPLDFANVGGATKPANNADVTADNTAAAIANQGAFATLDKITGTNVSTYIANAAIDLAQIDTATITNLSAIVADMGTITAGKMQSSDGKFVIDLNNKTISIET